MNSSLHFQAYLVTWILFGTACVGTAQQLPDSNSLIKQSLDTETIDVSVLNLRLKNEAGLNVEQSQKWLETRVRTVMLSESPNESTKPSKIGIDTDDGKNFEMSLDGSGHGVKVVDDLLVVVAHDHEVQKVRELIDTFTRFGIRQIAIRTHVFRDTAEAMKALPIQWSNVEAASKIAESDKPSNIKPASYEKAQPLTAAARYVEAQKPTTFEDLPPPEGVTSATWTEATSIVERATPVLYTLLTATEHKEVLAHAKKLSTVQRVMSPSVIVFNGQIASMSNCVERPFITGVKALKLGPEGKQQLEFAPHIKVYHEGTTIKIRPQLFGGPLHDPVGSDARYSRCCRTGRIQGADARSSFDTISDLSRYANRLCAGC
jgi:hypothetical protein